jgi:hypothetical protein
MIHPTLKESEPGIYTRKATAKPTGKSVQAYYKAQAQKILKDDKNHYYRLAKRFTPLMDTEFFSVADIGGGHPKLASKMNVSEVTVYDAYAPMYEKTHKDFLALYPTAAKVEYKKAQITHGNFSPNAEVGIMCHVLEHLTVEQIRRLLENIEVNKVLVYGPNVEKAQNENWIHYRPKDHVTFCTLEDCGSA